MFVNELEEINYLRLSLNRKLRALCRKIVDLAIADGQLAASGNTFELVKYHYDDMWLSAIVDTQGHQIQVNVPMNKLTEVNNLLQLPE